MFNILNHQGNTNQTTLGICLHPVRIASNKKNQNKTKHTKCHKDTGGKNSNILLEGM